MQTYELGNCKVSLDKEGARRYQKLSSPTKYGFFHEVALDDYVFQYNLNGEIRYIQGKNKDWPHPAEWLKRTVGNDWVYYFSGGYTNIYDCLGEYYLPCFSYPSNSLWDRDPFRDSSIQKAIKKWPRVPELLIKKQNVQNFPQELKDFIHKLKSMNPARLWQRSLQFFSILKERVSVLPPDTRHVDYDFIPVIIADGCLYNCGFCSIKSNRDFQVRSRQDIIEQLKNLKNFYGADRKNYNSLFLGQHDALNCDSDLIEFTATQAYEILEFESSYLKDRCSLFLFGSVDSFLAAPESLFDYLNSMPFYTYINLGLESADQSTLEILRKPISSAKVQDAFARMLDMNKKFQHIEITANFVTGPNLPETHWVSLQHLVMDKLSHFYPKGTIYLSPLQRKNRKEQLRQFKRQKMQSRLPMYLYLLQRL